MPQVCWFVFAQRIFLAQKITWPLKNWATTTSPCQRFLRRWGKPKRHHIFAIDENIKGDHAKKHIIDRMEKSQS